jgi:GNAT superfamily N-acetyltransferase
MTTIERLTPLTCDEAIPLLAQQLDEHDIPFEPEQLRFAVIGLTDATQRGALLLARESGRAVGVAALSYVWSLEHGGLSAWLDELFVVPERRGRGIGQRLLDEARRLARDAGCLGIDLEVQVGHERAHRLYQRAGFRRLARSRWILSLAPARDQSG